MLPCLSASPTNILMRSMSPPVVGMGCLLPDGY
jgi:hypothetical protein